MVDYVASLERLRRHAAVVQRMEFAIKNDPANRKLRIGLGSAQRREAESRRAFEDAAAANQIDLVRYKIANESNVNAGRKSKCPHLYLEISQGDLCRHGALVQSRFWGLSG